MDGLRLRDAAVGGVAPVPLPVVNRVEVVVGLVPVSAVANIASLLSSASINCSMSEFSLRVGELITLAEFKVHCRQKTEKFELILATPFVQF